MKAFFAILVGCWRGGLVLRVHKGRYSRFSLAVVKASELLPNHHSLLSTFRAPKMARNPIDSADPRNRKLIIDLYEERGEGYIRAEFGVTRAAICRWRSLQRQTGSLAPHFSERGRKKKLTRAEVLRLERALLEDPFLTNRELAAKVGNKITPQVAGEYIRKSSHRFVSKLEQLDVETTFTARHVEEGTEFQARVRRVPIRDRVYVDETWIGAGVRRRKGRFPSGSPAWAARNRKYPRKTVIAAINQDGWLHPAKILNKGSITTADFEDYVESVLAPCLQEGDVVFWDQLGKSGRARNPTATHYSPTAKATVADQGARVEMLPPAGKLFSPLEVVLGETKRIYDKEIARLTRNRKPSSLRFEELCAAWHKAEGLVNASTFAHAFSQRANGAEFQRVCKEKGLLP